MAEHEYFGNSTGQRLLEKLKTALGGKANQSEVARLSKEIADLEVKTSRLFFISPNGNDSNDGLTANTPKKTVKACVSAGATRISAKRGVYVEKISLSNIGELEIFPTDNDLTYTEGVERDPIVFEMVDRIVPSNLASYNAIKRIAYSNANNTQFDKVFTKQSQPPVVGDGYGSRFNSTVWLLSGDERTVCIKLKPVLTLAECESEANTFTYVSGYIYINADLTGVESIVVPANWETGFYVNGAERITLREVEVRFSGTYNIDIRNCAYFDFYKCACKYTSYASGFHPFNSNGKMVKCYAAKNFDGYGISGYGHTTYIDCVAEFNFDDGMSHHDGTSGTVIGGRFEGNGKGGNVPAYGANVNIYGGLYKNNGSFGIGYLYASGREPANGMVQGAVMVGNPVGLNVNQNCDVVEMLCHYEDNATDKTLNGNVTGYDYGYVRTVNNIKPDENGNVKIEVSNGGDTPTITNFLPLAVNLDNSEYVGENGEDGYKVGYRVSSSGVEKAATNCCCTGFVPVLVGDEVEIEKFTPETTGYGAVYFFNASGTVLTKYSINSPKVDDNGVLSFTVPSDSALKFFRFTAKVINAETVIRIKRNGEYL